MSGSQLLRLRVNERLEAAVEEIFGLVEKTITEYEEEAVRSKREIGQLKQQLEQLVVLKPEVILNRADTQPVFKTRPPSLQQHEIKVEGIPVLQEAKVHEHPRVKEEAAERRLSPDMEVDACNKAEVKREINHLTQHIELLAVLKAEVTSFTADTRDIRPSQQPDRLATRDAEQIKEEQEEMSISPDAFNVVEVGDEHREPLPSSTAESAAADNGRTEMDRSPSPLQSRSAELEQPPRGDRSCRFCGEIFWKDSFLIEHVATSHRGHKAFRCLQCKKEFEQRYRMVLHTRIHTGEKPFSCDYCDKTFTQSSGRIVHMRKHKGGKHGTAQRAAWTCFKCNKEFIRKKQLVLHVRFHRCEKPFRCDFCGKVFAGNASRLVHMKRHTSVRDGVRDGRQPLGGGSFDERFTRKSARIIHMWEHAGEKPHPCEKCGKRFTSRGNCARHAECCTGTRRTNGLAAQHAAEPFAQQLQLRESEEERKSRPGEQTSE